MKTQVKVIEQQYISGINSLAQYLGMNYETCKKVIGRGLIPKRYIGKKLMFKISEVDNAISEPVNIELIRTSPESLGE